MYNEGLKINFIRNYTQSINTANVATTVFTAFEPHEEAWGADLCTKSTEELQPVIDEIVGLRSKSQWMSLTILKEYVKWCITMNVPGACDGMLRITAVGLDKVRKQMVTSPLHLQRYLNEVFDPEDDETIDNLYRCYYWMAFSGIREEDTLSITASDVDFMDMSIRYGENCVPLYRESLPAFHNAVELPGFCTNIRITQKKFGVTEFLAIPLCVGFGLPQKPCPFALCFRTALPPHFRMARQSSS